MAEALTTFVRDPTLTVGVYQGVPAEVHMDTWAEDPDDWTEQEWPAHARLVAVRYKMKREGG